MRTILLALAVVAVTARLLRRCDHAWRIYGPEDICDKCQRTRSCRGADDCRVEADDSEVVGMPTTWSDRMSLGNSWTLPRFCDVCHLAVPATERRRVGDLSGHLPCVEYPHRYITLAPTSRN